MNVSKSPGIQFLIAGAVVFGLWRITGLANTKLAEIPVKAPPATAAPVPSTDTRRIYPATAMKPVARVKSADADVDAVFRGRVAEAEADLDPPPPDYSGMFQAQIQLQGIASNGAFLNGRFYVVGQAMSRLAIARADGSQLVPKLAGLGDGYVTISADGVPTVIRLQATNAASHGGS